MPDPYFYIERKILNHWLWQIKPFSPGQAWIDMIGLANHCHGIITVRGITVNLERGDLGWSAPRLAMRWGWSRTKLRLFFTRLKKEHQIVQQKNNVTSVISICNYEKYQVKNQQKKQQTGQQKDSRKTAEEQQKDPNKELEELEELKKLKKKAICTLAEASTFCLEIGLPESDGQWFFDKCQGNGWLNGKNPIKDWKSTIRAWRTAGYMASQNQRQMTLESPKPTGPTMEELQEKYRAKK